MVPFPLELSRAQGPIVGYHRYRGADVEVRLSRPDLHYGHLELLGATGQGKSTLAQHLAGQLLAVPDRPALVFLDPHGTAALDFARQCIPVGRQGDVGLLELGETEHPVSLPFIQRLPGLSDDQLIESTFTIFRLLFREQWSPTRMEDAV
jgi:hypothetical protein